MSDITEAADVAERGFRDLGLGLRERTQTKVAIALKKREIAAQQNIAQQFAQTPEGQTGVGKTMALGIATGQIKPMDAMKEFMNLHPDQMVPFMAREAALSGNPRLQAWADAHLSAYGYQNKIKAMEAKSGQLESQQSFGQLPTDVAAARAKASSQSKQGLLKPLDGGFFGKSLENISDKNGNITIPGKAIGATKDIPYNLNKSFISQITPMLQPQKGITTGFGLFGTTPPLSKDEADKAFSYVQNLLKDHYDKTLQDYSPFYQNPAAADYRSIASNLLTARTMGVGKTATFYNQTASGKFTAKPIQLGFGVDKSLLTYSPEASAVAITSDQKLQALEKAGAPKEVLDNLRQHPQNIDNAYQRTLLQLNQRPANKIPSEMGAATPEVSATPTQPMPEETQANEAPETTDTDQSNTAPEEKETVDNAVD